MVLLPKESTILPVVDRFFGKSNFNKIDKTYVSTLWRTIFLIPFWPLKSYRIKHEKNTYNPNFVMPGVTVSYSVIEEVPLQKKQIIITIISTLLTFALLSYFFYFLFTVGA